jgi:hypothetical protein
MYLHPQSLSRAFGSLIYTLHWASQTQQQKHKNKITKTISREISLAGKRAFWWFWVV